MSFTEYVIACERLVFDMKTFHWFIIKDISKELRQRLLLSHSINSTNC